MGKRSFLFSSLLFLPILSFIQFIWSNLLHSTHSLTPHSTISLPLPYIYSLSSILQPSSFPSLRTLTRRWQLSRVVGNQWPVQHWTFDYCNYFLSIEVANKEDCSSRTNLQTCLTSNFTDNMHKHNTYLIQQLDLS